VHSCVFLLGFSLAHCISPPWFEYYKKKEVVRKRLFVLESTHRNCLCHLQAVSSKKDKFISLQLRDDPNATPLFGDINGVATDDNSSAALSNFVLKVTRKRVKQSGSGSAVSSSRKQQDAVKVELVGSVGHRVSFTGMSDYQVLSSSNSGLDRDPFTSPFVTSRILPSFFSRFDYVRPYNFEDNAPSTRPANASRSVPRGYVSLDVEAVPTAPPTDMDSEEQKRMLEEPLVKVCVVIVGACVVEQFFSLSLSLNMYIYLYVYI